MIEIQGKYNKAKVFTDNIKETADIVKVIKPIYNFETEERQRKFQELMRRAENGEGELTITFGGAKLEEFEG